MGQSVSFQDDVESPQQQDLPGAFPAREEVNVEIPDMAPTVERTVCLDSSFLFTKRDDGMADQDQGQNEAGGGNLPTSNSLAAPQVITTQVQVQQRGHGGAWLYGNNIGGNAVVALGDHIGVVNQGLDEREIQRILQEERSRQHEEMERQRQRGEERQKVEQREGLRKEIRDWFAPDVKFHAIQQENYEKWTDGTLAWFTDGEDYQAWKNGEPRIIWGTGIPGAGKTVLASRIISDLRQLRVSSPKKICIVFAFCRYSEPLKVNDILEALVKQFLQADSSLADLAESLYKQHVENKTRPTQRELLDLLRQMEHRFDIVFYVIDGLDEALVDTQFDLILAIKNLRGQFALTSRPVQTLQSGLPTTGFYSVNARSSDIRRLVVQKVERNPGFCSLLRRHSYLDDLVQSIADKSNGMFLHAALQIEFVQHCPTIAQLKDALNRFPAKIEDLYVETMRRINEQQKPKADLANHVLLWLVFGREALDFLDLQQALRLTLPNHDGQVHKDDLLSACCGLVTVEENTDLVRLVHFTAHESLPPLLKKYLPEPHGLLFLATTRKLIECGAPTNEKGLTEEDDFDSWLSQDPLLRYSYDHWTYHAQESMANPKYSDEVRQFLCQCTSFPAVANMDPYQSQREALTLFAPLHVAARYGLHQFLDSLLMGTAGGDVTLRTGGLNDLTALMLASRYGHVETVDALLAYSDGGGRPELHVPNDHVNLRDGNGWTALMYAAVLGHMGVITRLLAHKGADANIADNTGRTALFHVVAKGHDGADERFLARHGTDVYYTNISNDTRRMAASQAVKLGREGELELLLAHRGTDVNIADKTGRTPLIHAVERVLEGTVERLLAHESTDVNIADDTGCTALIHAVKWGHGGEVQRLLAHKDTDVNIVDREGRTALIYAAVQGYEGAITRLLAHQGTNVNIADITGCTALVHAVIRGHGGAVRRLLAHKATDVNITDSRGWTVLIHAVEHRRESAVEHLLAHQDTNVNIPDDKGRTALIHAVERRLEGELELLLAHKGTDVDVADKTGRTALIHAVERKLEGAVKHLLAREDTNVNIADDKGRTALIRAVEERLENMVELLLRHKDIDVNKADGKGDTALIVASRKCFPQIVHLLLQHGVGIDANHRNLKGQTALMVAPEGRRHSWFWNEHAEERVVKLLAEFEQRSARSSS